MDAPSPTVFDARQRAWRYWFADGLTYVLVGIATLLMSICLLYPPPPHAYWRLALWAVMLGLYGGLILGRRQILEWLKSKITYPRTGYTHSPFAAADMAGSPGTVELGLGAEDERRAEAQRLVATQTKHSSLAVALFIAGWFAMLLIKSRWAYTVIGVLFALALWALRKNERVSWLAILGLPLLGLCMGIFAVPGSGSASARFMAGCGGLFVLDGAITLTRYLLRNPMSKVAGP